MALLQDYNRLFEQNTEVKKIIVNGNVVWPAIVGPDYTEPFYIEDASGSTNEIGIVQTGTGIEGGGDAPTLTIEKSTDKTTWSTAGTTSTTAFTIQIPANGKVYLRCSTDTWGGNTYASTLGNRFVTTTNTGNFNVGGNIMSLLYGSSFRGNETTFPGTIGANLKSIFQQNTRIVDASKLVLPATTLRNYCYSNMFNGCTGLVNGAITLSATILAPVCYNSMFVGCTALTTAPALPATTLANSCYGSMFQGCYALTTAPQLPATTLVDVCYSWMFRNCSSLNDVTCLATDLSATDCTSSWLYGVNSSGTFTKATGVTWPTGDSGIPSGWTVEEV